MCSFHTRPTTPQGAYATEEQMCIALSTGTIDSNHDQVSSKSAPVLTRTRPKLREDVKICIARKLSRRRTQQLETLFLGALVGVPREAYDDAGGAVRRAGARGLAVGLRGGGSGQWGFRGSARRLGTYCHC